MRFRLTHLFLLLLISATAFAVLDRCSRSTFAVTFSDAKLSLDSNEEPTGYTFTFSIRGDQLFIDGSAADTFGYNELFGSTVSESNLSQFDGREIQVSYRKHQFLWLPATRVEDAIKLHFRHLIIWQDKLGAESSLSYDVE